MPISVELPTYPIAILLPKLAHNYHFSQAQINHKSSVLVIQMNIPSCPIALDELNEKPENAPYATSLDCPAIPSVALMPPMSCFQRVSQFILPSCLYGTSETAKESPDGYSSQAATCYSFGNTQRKPRWNSPALSLKN